jgi:hypothetical protein
VRAFLCIPLGGEMAKGNLYVAIILILIGALAILGLAVGNASGAGLRGFLDRLERHHQLILTLLTALLVLVTALLWWSTRDLVLEGRETAQRQLRAYVAILGGGMMPNQDGSAIHVWVDLENSGQTPGYAFSTWIKARVDLPNAQPFNDEMPVTDREGVSIIGSKAKAHLNITHALGQNDLDAIDRGEPVIFVWGGADYSDAFGTSHTFKFRSRSGPRQRDGGWSLQPHKIGYMGN